MALFVVLLLSIYGIKSLFQHHLQQPLNITKTEILNIESGTSFNAFSKKLVNKGWIESRFWLRNYVRLYPELSLLKAGSYQIPADTNLMTLLTLLVEGKEHQYQITFVEGSTFKEWLALIQNSSNIKHTLKSLSIAQIAERLDIKQNNPEGLFFPDTYAYTANTTDISLLARAHQKMTTVLKSQWLNKQDNLPYQSPYEALIMASIIEKESGVMAEQPLISSVFVNRLRKKMRLQTDPTVIYGLGDRYQGDIKYKHLREKTAYNTYKINGLPPTPIAMPGLKAIHAALNPDDSDYFYFVSNGAGKHIFSTNLADHNKAVRQYQLKK